MAPLTALLAKQDYARMLALRRAYRATYNLDLRADIKGETGGDYGRMVYYATA